MRFGPNNTSVPRVSILLAAILLGIAIGITIVPNWVLISVRPTLFSIGLLSATVLCIAAFILLGLAYLASTTDRSHQLDRDLLEAFLEHIPDNVFFKDKESRFIRISRAMANYCGLKDPAHAIGKTDADIFSAEHAGQALADELRVLRTGAPLIEKEEKETWKDGHETWALTTKVPLKNREGEVIGTMGIAHNITHRKETERRIQHMALHDALTGLPNRTLLEDRLRQAIALGQRVHKHVAVLLLDLDRFKNVNDCFGHTVGDRLLVLAAERLTACIRKCDTVARLGGDEFVIAVQMAERLEGIEFVARKVLDALSEPFQVEDRELQISASIGICQFPEDGKNAEDLLQFADVAMYEAKERGRGRFCFFSPALTEATRREQKLESDLVQACARDEFEIHYQPLVETKSGRITGMEALLRWRHPEQGLLSPNQFIPKLEELGLIVEVGRWVLKTACRQAVEWQQNGLPPVRVAVNVSSQQFYEGNIAEAVAKVLQETKLDPRFLELELTESQTLDDSDATINIMLALKRLGVSLSLDDFGTGWSSLSYLRRFPIDRIKIDRSFVKDLHSQPAAEEVVKTILTLSRNLGIVCIAEGVETREQQDYFSKHDCAEMQGFYFSRPIPVLDVTALLRSRQVLGHVLR
ncbi:MAG: EAL domain-containing protein [Terracidiphilus sp.]|jgi:diguanylate cyclase (GGDEF)-like protein/PAS domain S-box-containing protein